jgi:hypothetical protein
MCVPLRETGGDKFDYWQIQLYSKEEGSGNFRGRKKMRLKATYILAILLSIFSVLIISCSQQNTRWKGTMEEVDGVTIVKIPLDFFPRTWKNKNSTP